MSHPADDATPVDPPAARAEPPSLPPLLAMALRHLAHGTGSADEFLDTRTALLAVPDLRPLLGGMPRVVGAIALRAYMPEWATDDLDVLVAAGDGQTALAALERVGYAVVAAHPRGGWRVAHPDAPRPVDVILPGAPWLRGALARPVRDLIGLPILPRPELLVLKLLTGRPQDFADGVRVLRATPTVAAGDGCAHPS